MAAHTGQPLSWAAKLLIGLVWCYRYTLRGLLGNQCRYAPSCSEYALQAISLHGAMRGFFLAVRRISRCHPWRPGGLDPVPEPECCGEHKAVLPL